MSNCFALCGQGLFCLRIYLPELGQASGTRAWARGLDSSDLLGCEGSALRTHRHTYTPHTHTHTLTHRHTSHAHTHTTLTLKEKKRKKIGIQNRCQVEVRQNPIQGLCSISHAVLPTCALRQGGRLLCPCVEEGSRIPWRCDCHQPG